MKKVTLNRIIAAAIIVLLLVATVFGAFRGIFGHDTQMVTIHENGEDTQQALYREVAFIPNTLNENWREAITPSAALGGGYSYTVTAEQGDMTDKEFISALKSSAKVLKSRATLVYGDADAEVEESSIVLTVPYDSYDSFTATLASVTGVYTLALANEETSAYDNVVLTADDIKQSYYSTTSASYYSTTETYNLQLELTKSGLSKINDAIANHAGETLALVCDGSAVAGISLSTSSLSDGILTITSDTQSVIYQAVFCLRSGALSITPTLADYSVAGASMGNFLNTVIIISGAVLLLAALFMLVRGRLTGLVGVWTLVIHVVVFCLLGALIAVDTGWTLTLFSLIAILLAGVAFLFGLLLVINRMAQVMGSGRGVRAAMSEAFNKNAKRLGILYGAITLIGVALMCIYQTALYGILGRLLALSAIGSFVMIYVFLRGILNCNVLLFGTDTRLYK